MTSTHVVRTSESEEIIEIEPRRSKHARISKDFGYDFYAYSLEEDPITLQEALITRC